MFGPGTKPSDWTVDPPTNEQLLTALAEQPARVKEFLTGKLDQQMPDVMSIGKFHDMATVEAVIQFAIWHEGIHAGIIFALNKMTAGIGVIKAIGVVTLTETMSKSLFCTFKLCGKDEFSK